MGRISLNNEYHPKFLERWARVFIDKYKKEGGDKAKDWINRTFPDDLIKLLVPIIHNGGKVKK